MVPSGDSVAHKKIICVHDQRRSHSTPASCRATYVLFVTFSAHITKVTNKIELNKLHEIDYSLLLHSYRDHLWFEQPPTLFLRHEYSLNRNLF